MTLFEALKIWYRSKRTVRGLEFDKLVQDTERLLAEVVALKSSVEGLKTNSMLGSVSIGELEKVKGRLNNVELRLGLNKHQGIA